MLKILTKKEFIISHGFIIFGLIFISCGILLFVYPYFPFWIPLIGGIWTLFGGICFTTIFILRKFRK